MAFRLSFAIRRGVSFRKNYSNSGSSDVIGFVGLGNMGLPMVRNLLQKGRRVMVYDVVKAQAEAAAKDGAIVAEGPSQIASEVKTLVTMLPESEHVRAVYTGDDGLLSSVSPGTLMIDSSTIDPDVSREMSRLAKEKGSEYVDAPVSGGVGAAAKGGLTFMVGGERTSFDQAKPILECMGKNVVHCGESGTGQAAKICNNMLLAISMIGTSEVLHLAQRLELDPKLCSQILNTSSGRCWSSDTYNPCPGVIEGVPSSNDYKGGFGTSLMRKDLRLAQTAVQATNAITPLGAMALQVYELMCQNGYKDKDFSSVFQFLERNS